MIPIVRLAFVAVFPLLGAGCQTASLEDAAPRSVPVPSNSAGIENSASVQTAVPGADGASAQPVPTRRNPGLPSLVPIEKTAAVENKVFVATGASRTGQYPTFGRQPKAANAQFSDADKLAAEAEMTELLRNRASTPDARAQYEARLRELRALAANHGNDTQQEIEN